MEPFSYFSGPFSFLALFVLLVVVLGVPHLLVDDLGVFVVLAVPHLLIDVVAVLLLVVAVVIGALAVVVVVRQRLRVRLEVVRISIPLESSFFSALASRASSFFSASSAPKICSSSSISSLTSFEPLALAHARAGDVVHHLTALAALAAPARLLGGDAEPLGADTHHQRREHSLEFGGGAVEREVLRERAAANALANQREHRRELAGA